MNKSLIFVLITAVLLLTFSLSFADYANYAGPQLEYISNAVSLLWGKPKADVLSIMGIFPDFICTDYIDQIGCVSRFNTNNNDNIFLNFFMDDYEEHHDNLWKLSVTADVKTADQFQSLFQILWLEGMEPAHKGNEQEFTYQGVQPLIFKNKTTRMIAYFQPFDLENNPFFLVEYYPVSLNR
ncbi:MAG: hypothetical protein IJI14_20515 [Anaerolineaceae bacterium]|nr:hypothetical protein [Anaerolineaceae bacterium]